MTTNAEKITVLVVEPEKKPYVKDIDPGLKSLQKEVGGFIEGVYPFEEPVAIICNEEAKLNGSQLNRALRDDEGHIYDIVAGTFLVVGVGEENFSSLSPEYIKKFSELYQTPELFIRMNGKLVVLPVEEEQPKERKPSVLNKLNDLKEQTAPSAARKSHEREER